ncbi:putative Solute carrier family 46 member 3 [Hypsibius exemplaris]|uniref:Solute carrier family 46 member 3 n=1 Tax=Hypsibius exemplaris TaxID=2072580 RepID=A0A1W0WG40_HYPEX|nr:putative Solute carrier family 46 member 3 [Hypsibius exemplaris]
MSVTLASGADWNLRGTRLCMMDPQEEQEGEGEVHPSRWSRTLSFLNNQALRTIPAVLLFGLAFGVSQPVYTELIKDRVCELVLGYPTKECEHAKSLANHAHSDAIRTVASDYVFYRNLVMSLPCVVLSQFIGQWSDKYGRKVPMMMPFAGLFICGVILLFCAYYPIHPVFMIVASLCAACLGGWMMFPMALFAYIGDYTDNSNRTVIMGIATGAQAIGTTLGLLSGGMLLQSYGFAVPFILFCALLASAFFYVLFFVKDIAPFPLPLTFQWSTFKSLFVLSNLRDNLATLRRKREHNARLHFALLIVTVLISATVIDGEPQIFQLFVEFPPLNWNVQEFSNYAAVLGAVAGFFMPILFLIFKRKFGMKDSTIGVVSVLSGIVCAYGFAIATEAWMVFTAAAVGILRTLHAVSAKSILTGGVDKHEIGKIMAVTSSVQAFAPTLTGGVFLNIFGSSASWWPGFCFAVAAYSLLFSLVTFCFIDVDRRKQQNKSSAA